MSLGFRCSPERWNNDQGKVIGNKEDARIINNGIEQKKFNIIQAKNKIEQQGLDFSLTNLKNFLQNKALFKNKLLLNY